MTILPRGGPMKLLRVAGGIVVVVGLVIGELAGRPRDAITFTPFNPIVPLAAITG